VQRRILITGAAGQLGRALIRILEREAELLPIDRVRASDDIVLGDITDSAQVEEIVSGFKPDIIINTAAYTDVDGNERNRELAQLVNVKGVEYLVGAADRTGGRIIQISTDYVFNGQSGPYLESDPVDPISVYGRTKWEAEQLLSHRNTNLVVRTNVLIGPGHESPASFVRWVVQSLQAGKKIRVVNDQINNPTLTTHLAEAIAVAIQKEGQGLYHYGGLEFCSRYEFALKIAAYFDLSADDITPISTEELDQLAPRPLKSGLICSKMKIDLGVRNYNIEETLIQAFPKEQA
jgi:dTDP-4-dehydrorhamnose reductase